MEKQTRNPAVLVIGAGMSGILLGIKLREAGITDITIVEKGDGVGGTWRENTYPGVSCDVPAHMYAYSFEPFVGWDDRFAEGAQIRQYFEQTADKYGITELVRFNEEVTAAQYRDGRWQVTTSKGDALSVDFIVAATGILHHPSVPDIPGLSDFAGPAFHTARWDHKLDFSGKRVGVIGTGSTAAQVIPALVGESGRASINLSAHPAVDVPAPGCSLLSPVQEDPRPLPVPGHPYWPAVGVVLRPDVRQDGDRQAATVLDYRPNRAPQSGKSGGQSGAARQAHPGLPGGLQAAGARLGFF
ncbi:MAG: NAD(P)/FAD-dependent oxidoreductase [Pseudomonadota bacterium]|nr:NAD(P)/FAD-dependent oxidoreductase [Pseudomonadota bacterium]